MSLKSHLFARSVGDVLVRKLICYDNQEHTLVSTHYEGCLISYVSKLERSFLCMTVEDIVVRKLICYDTREHIQVSSRYKGQLISYVA